MTTETTTAAEAAKTRCIVIDPVDCRMFEGNLPHGAIADLANVLQKHADRGDAVEELALEGHVLLWLPSAKVKADNAASDDGEAPARWAWYDGGTSAENSDTGARQPDRFFAGMGVLFGPRDADGNLTNATFTKEEISSRVGFDPNRMKAALIANMLMRSLGLGADNDDECDCPACQMEKQATTAERSRARN